MEWKQLDQLKDHVMLNKWNMISILFLYSHFRVEGRTSALHGDWPWHVALYKNGNHVCDGTLMNERWIMTTASCFQG